MPQTSSRRKRNAKAFAVLLLALASVLLAACGGSSKSSSSSVSASAAITPGKSTTTTPGKLPGAADPSRFLAMRECLKKNGITFPVRKPGQVPGSGPTLPAGVSAAQLQAIEKKCGGGVFRGPRTLGKVGTHLLGAAFAKFAACMRENGVKLGEPNTSGKGPIFNTTGINTHTAAFTAAENKCRNSLRGAFHASPGAGG